MVKIETGEHGTLLTLTPNQSASWSLVVFTLIGISTITLLIAIIWALLGVWFILPFAGLELLLLALVLYRVNYRCFELELLFEQPEKIRLEKGKGRVSKSYVFDKNASEFVITLPRHSLSPPGLELHDGEHSTRVGCLLNCEDMNALVTWVKQSRIPHRVKGKTLVRPLANFDRLD